MARGIAYVVFLMPVILSVIFGSTVLGQVLQEPERQLNMIPNFEFQPKEEQQPIHIIGLKNTYSVSESIKVQIKVDDTKFTCGDLYITIFELTTKEVLSQNGFFDQCFDETDLLPIDDEFTESIKSSGEYELMVELLDKTQKDSLSISSKFKVE